MNLEPLGILPPKCPDCGGPLESSDTGEPNYEDCWWCPECKTNVFDDELGGDDDETEVDQ